MTKKKSLAGPFDNYEFRASSVGKIVPGSEELSTTTKTYLTELAVEHLDGIKKIISNKYFDKGTFNEVDGIYLLNKALFPNHFLIKNTERKSNGWVTGEIDILDPEDVINDIKNAYDKITFEKATLTTEYEWQLRAYMWLWKKIKARLFYCLTNLPEHLIADEEKKIYWNHQFLTTEDPEYYDLCSELRAKHNYDLMQDWQKFKTWDIEHDDDKIEKLKSKITKCRNFMNKLYHDRIAHYEKNKTLMGIPSVLIVEYDKESGATIIS